jgi:hypothetical protein
MAKKVVATLKHRHRQNKEGNSRRPFEKTGAYTSLREEMVPQIKYRITLPAALSNLPLLLLDLK